ncbi:MAG: hypothetical protein HUJ96_03780, partial [Marinilabiliaceae bacterium]|nr:hypothetical protein [Marinilabiliaceae bacterium]
EASTVKGYSDLLKEIDDLKADSVSLAQDNEKLKEKCDTLKEFYYLQKGQLVDLGLKSGTLWAAYNVGATKPEEYGSYFAWGETAEKAQYTEQTSDWYDKKEDNLKDNGVIDDKGNLTAEYDAATKNWGEDWRMPTFDEIVELLDLNNENQVINGVKGRIFYGDNGNTLFLPFAGDYYNQTLYGVDEYTYGWSATFYEKNNANTACLMTVTYKTVYNGNLNRSHGRSVRAVLKTKK